MFYELEAILLKFKLFLLSLPVDWESAATNPIKTINQMFYYETLRQYLFPLCFQNTQG